MQNHAHVQSTENKALAIAAYIFPEFEQAACKTDYLGGHVLMVSF